MNQHIGNKSTALKLLSFDNLLYKRPTVPVYKDKQNMKAEVINKDDTISIFP